jgi:folate-dependent phosphoribosylglycinamide formyltransferase PurN
MAYAVSHVLQSTGPVRAHLVGLPSKPVAPAPRHERMSSAPLRVVLICHHDAPLHYDGLARWIASWATLSGVVVIREPSSVVRRRIRREWRRVGAWRFIDVLAFRVYYRLKFAGQDQSWIDQQLAALRSRFADVPADTRTIEVQSPGSRESQAFIEAAQPDFVLALCKNILPERVFSIPRLGTFVFHPGICPEYRNAHGCFWALASGDREHVGMTLLRIDKGVDTGPIFGHFGAEVDEVGDTHIRIQNRVVLDNLDGIRAKLLEVAEGAARPIDVAGRASREWGQPWLTAWRRWKSMARRRQRAHRRA